MSLGGAGSSILTMPEEELMAEATVAGQLKEEMYFVWGGRIGGGTYGEGVLFLLFRPVVGYYSVQLLFHPLLVFCCCFNEFVSAGLRYQVGSVGYDFLSCQNFWQYRFHFSFFHVYCITISFRCRLLSPFMVIWIVLNSCGFGFILRVLLYCHLLVLSLIARLFSRCYSFLCLFNSLTRWSVVFYFPLIWLRLIKRFLPFLVSSVGPCKQKKGQMQAHISKKRIK